MAQNKKIKTALVSVFYKDGLDKILKLLNDNGVTIADTECGALSYICQKNNVKFLGRKLNPYPYMLLADYIILTSDYEGFPVTYLEAITLNKQIITTIDVSDESIDIGKDYAHIISKEEKEMVKQVEKILTKSKKQKQIDLIDIQNKRIKKLEKIFNEVI